jgi:hypothetical protein
VNAMGSMTLPCCKRKYTWEDMIRKWEYCLQNVRP